MDQPQSRSQNRADYKRRWAVEHQESVRKRRREYYWRNAEQARAATKTYHQGLRVHATAADLERLRLPENRLEALAHGPEQRQIVCLNCGGIFDGNFSRHPSACPRKPRSNYDADAYREQWGYEKSNPLVSADWSERRSATLRNSEAFHKAQKLNEGRTLDAFAAERKRQSNAKAAGKPIRRGHVRAETRQRRVIATWPHNPRKLRKPQITDVQIERILALDLPIAESARRAGLSPTAFYRRVQRRHGWSAAGVKARRSIVTKYVFGLRKWLQANPRASVEDVLSRHSVGVRGPDSKLFQRFRPFFPHFEAELKAQPQWLGKLVEVKPARLTNNKGRLQLGNEAMALASKVFQRARAKAGGESAAALIEKRRRGRPDNKGDIFRQAQKLHGLGLSWAAIAQRLVPDEYREDRRAAAHRLRVGVQDLKKKKEKN